MLEVKEDAKFDLIHNIIVVGMENACRMVEQPHVMPSHETFHFEHRHIGLLAASFRKPSF